RAVSPTGKSNYTNNLQITPLADTEEPTPPQNLTQVSRTISSVSLSWTAATDNTGIAQYYIYYGSTVIPTGSTATTYNVTGLAANENFLFTVKAVDFSNNFSQPSNQLETTTGFNGLNYEHSTGAWNLLTEIDWSIKEITGTVPDFTIAPRSQEDFFNFRHYGYLFINSGGNYRFRTRSDDGSMLYLHGWFDGINFSTYRIVNHDGLHGNSYSAESANQSLSSSSSYPISSIYFERGGGQSLTVEYKGPDTNENWIAIPASALTSGSAPPLSPPNPPAGLVAASISMTSIHLDWTHLPPPPADFEIYRSTDNIIFNIIATSDVSEYIDNNLLPSTLYYYKVRSISTSGSSGFSAVTSATTQGDLVSPSVPANVTLLTNTYTNAGLTWDASTDNVWVTGYKIFINSTLVDSTETNTFFTTALLPETSYEFTISAYDASGNESAQSSIKTVVTNTPITYYSLPTGELNQLSTWNSESDGSGNTPTSFAYNGQYYHINRTAALTNQWVIGGSISKVIVDDNIDLSLGQALNGNLRVGENSSLNVNYQGNIVFDQLAATS
ncbi:MAG: PA14 domain-containing protein, partial [Cyclobacteriaceae bacterium]